MTASDFSWLRPDDHLPTIVSLVVVYGSLALFIAWAVLAFVRAGRAARQARLAEAAFDGAAPLLPGTVTLRGIVEYAPGAEAAVRLEVTQAGTESESSGTWTTRWSEVHRWMHVEPFYLRHSSGQRIRVEPTRDVFLVDAMDGAIWVNTARRKRVAELTPGEEVFVHGLLSRELAAEAQDGAAYRAAPEIFVLRPPRGGSMLLSTEGLGRRFRRWRRFYARAGVWLTVAALVQGLCWLPFHLRCFASEIVQAPIARCEQWTTKDDEGDDVQHYGISAALPGSGVLAEDLDVDDWKRLKQGDIIPWRAVRRVPQWSAVGLTATVHAGYFISFGIMLILSLIIYAVAKSAATSWYEKAKFEESESGRLAQSAQRAKAKGASRAKAS